MWPIRQQTTERDSRRRGTILVFVLAMLGLLATIGFTLLASTRADRIRITNRQAGTSLDLIMDDVIESVRVRLRDDVWGEDTQLLNSNPYLPPDDVNLAEARRAFNYELDEPFDAPGPFDRWLASLMPHQTDPTNPDSPLRWNRVSYVGTDIGRTQLIAGMLGATYASPLRPSPDGYALDRINAVTHQPEPGFSILRDIEVWDGLFGYYYRDTAAPDRLPHDFTIREGRLFWDGIAYTDEYPVVANALANWRALSPLNAAAKFPYFDRDLDGVLDLYDADNDGVADSPLSYEMYIDGVNGPEPVYVAVRIVDNSAMVNLNTASAIDTAAPLNTVNANDLFLIDAIDIGVTDPIVRENIRNRQLRGRRATEIVLDPDFDWDWTNNTVKYDAFAKPLQFGDVNSGAAAGMVNYRANGNTFYAKPLDNHNIQYAYYGGIARSMALGFEPSITGSETRYRTFDARDELSLRNNFCLTPREVLRQPDNIPLGTPNPLLPLVEIGLPATLRWSQEWVPSATGSYSNAPAKQRWYSFDTEALQDTNVVSAMPMNVHSYRELLNPDAGGGVRNNFFIHRPLFTTVSYDTTRYPAPIKSELDPASPNFDIWRDVQPSTPSPLTPLRFQIRLPSGVWKTMSVPPGANRREKVDLNQAFDEGPLGGPGVDDNALTNYMGWLVWSIYVADPEIYHAGVAIPSGGQTLNGPASSMDPTYGGKLKVRRALQLAANILDFRDSNNEPTVIVNKQGVSPADADFLYMPIVGIERQPFISEVVSWLQWDAAPGGVLSDEYAIEICNPYNNVFTGALGTYKLAWRDLDVAGGFRIANVEVDIESPVTFSNGHTVLYTDARFTNLISGPAGKKKRLINNATNISLNKEQDWIALTRQIPVLLPDGTEVLIDWVIDRVDFDETNIVEDAPGMSWRNDPGGLTINEKGVVNCVQRDEHNWKFGNARSELTSANIDTDADVLAVTSLGQAQNDPDLPDNVPVAWTVRDRGLDVAPANNLREDIVWSFDSPAEMSRVLAFGTDWRADKVIDNVSGTTNGRVFDWFTPASALPPMTDNFRYDLPEAEPATYWIARTQAFLNPIPQTGEENARRMAVGRINWFEQDPALYREPGRLFNYIGCNMLGSDGINNDGDTANAAAPTNNNQLVDENAEPTSPFTDVNGNGRVDDSEAATCFFRNAGLINVNTAPAAVLRAVPYMSSTIGFVPPQFNTTWDVAANIVAVREKRDLPRTLGLPNTGVPANPPTIYRTLSDLTAAISIAPAIDNIPMPEHRTAVAGVPDWDRTYDFMIYTMDAATFDTTDELRERDALLSRWSNVLSTRSDTFTAYIGVFNEDGKALRHSVVVLDRSECVGRDPALFVINNLTVPATVGVTPSPLPRIVAKSDVGLQKDTD